MSKPKLFISHSTNELPTTDRSVLIREHLYSVLSNGWDVFLDRERIRPGDKWRTKILQNLRQAQAGIILFNEKATQSDWVTAETLILCFYTSINPQFKLIPLLLDGKKIDDTCFKQYEPFQLNGIQNITDDCSLEPEDFVNEIIQNLDPTKVGSSPMNQWVTQETGILKNVDIDTPGHAAEQYFEILYVRIEREKEEIIAGRQSLNKLLDDVADIQQTLQRIKDTGTATHENTEDIKKSISVLKDQMAKLFENNELHSVNDAIKMKPTEKDIRAIAEIKTISKAIQETGITIDPDHFYNIGIMSVYQRRFEDAEYYFNKVLAADSEYNDAHTGLGILYQLRANDMLQRGDFASVEPILNLAEMHIRKALHLDPANIEALCQLGYIFKEVSQQYILIKKPDKAIKPLEKAKAQFEFVLRNDPQNAGAYNGMGNVYYLQHDLDRAIANNEKAIQIDPSYLFAHHDLAGVYLSKANEDISSQQEFYLKALKEYIIVLQLNEKQPSLNPESVDKIRNLINEIRGRVPDQLTTFE